MKIDPYGQSYVGGGMAAQAGNAPALAQSAELRNSSWAAFRRSVARSLDSQPNRLRHLGNGWPARGQSDLGVPFSRQLTRLRLEAIQRLLEDRSASR